MTYIPVLLNDHSKKLLHNFSVNVAFVWHQAVQYCSMLIRTGAYVSDIFSSMEVKMMYHLEGNTSGFKKKKSKFVLITIHINTGDTKINFSKKEMCIIHV